MSLLFKNYNTTTHSKKGKTGKGSPLYKRGALTMPKTIHQSFLKDCLARMRWLATEFKTNA